MHIFGFVARKQGFIADLREFGGNLDNFVHSQVKRWGDASLVFRINALSTDNGAAGENLAIPGACFVAAKQVGERTPAVDNQKIWSFFFQGIPAYPAYCCRFGSFAEIRGILRAAWQTCS